MLSYGDKIKIDRLCDTFRRNFRITGLYSVYLERFPDIINEKIISELCGDGSIAPIDAIPALLGEIFGLDTDNSSEDRILMRDYIIPSVRILDAKKYTENPYYKNIKLPDVKIGAWEFRNEIYPAYRGVICDDMQICADFTEIPPLGFFTSDFAFPAVLEDGNEWMTLTPVDLDTCEEAIREAHGRVVTFGLGLGYYAYMASLKDTVESVTVIEKSPSVIELFNRYILPQFSHPEKVRIINEDAFEYAETKMGQEHYDLAFVDTWRDASDGAPMLRRMKMLEKHSPSTKFLYWIERFLLSRLRAEKFVEIREAYQSGSLEKDYAAVKRMLTDTDFLTS